MQVLKFGGSSVANATNISRVLDIVEKAAIRGRVVLVCSAVSGCTDTLLSIASSPRGSAEREVMIGALRTRHFEIVRRLFTGQERSGAEEALDALFEKLAAAPEDEMVTYGELFSTTIVARKLTCEGIRTKWLDSRILVIKDNPELTYGNISTAVALEPDVQVFVAPGFIASEYDGKVTTLGRGGSDFSASLFAAALKADRLEIWTDVPGMMTANPRAVPSAGTIGEMSYQAALDMASHGAKVLYAPAVRPAMEAGIDIHILDTFEPENPGTTVSAAKEGKPSSWAGVTSTDDTVAGETLICLVSDGPVHGESACARVGRCLKKAGIAPLGLSSDGTNVYVTVRLKVADAALGAIHREFFESTGAEVVNLFIAGFGAVGRAFVQMLSDTAAGIAASSGRVLRIAGISNSRKCIIDMSGIDPSSAGSRLEEEGVPAATFIPAVRSMAPRRSVFVDLTDSEDIHLAFESLLREGLNVVSSNRRSFAVPYVEYSAMMAAARENGCFVRYGTTVGSALPALESIARSATSGDEILSIEAVVSCTLNRILSSYARYPGTFAGIVRKAQEDGLTEADPRIDLNGLDALRKLLIIAREAGVPLEAEDVRVTSVLGPGYDGLSMEEFYRRLERDEPRFRADEEAAAKSRCRQRFVAAMRRDPASPLGYSASISIRRVPRSHPAFRIMGTENAVIIRSAFHPYPLLIQGAGEGAKQAAGSVLNDILR